MNLLSESNLEKWDDIRNNPFYSNMIEEVKKCADYYIDKPLTVLRYSDFNVFFKTGNRSEFEDGHYYKRRKLLNSYAFMSKLTGEKKYIQALENIIWAICDEYTWCVPAHLLYENNTIHMEKHHIDLFAAETGYALCEINYILGDALSRKIRNRIEYEVRERIIESYKTNKFDWEDVDSNWAAVCAGSVGNSFMYMAKEEEFYSVLPRLLKSMDNYLSGFNDDGACLEGYMYWWYGFGFYLQFASLLKQYTNHKYNLLIGEKINNIARFQQKIVLCKDRKITFSDADSPIFKHDIGYTHFIYKNFKDIEIPSMDSIMGFEDDHCYRWGAFIRRFIWSDSSLVSQNLGKKSYYLDGAEWFIKNTESYSFAAKCGNNNEPHNHNDIGSFIVCFDNINVLADLGAEEYVGGYFNNKKRYTNFFTPSSKGHSIPIINGKGQINGKDYLGKVIVANDDVFEINIEKAYDISCLDQLIRKFECMEDEIRITDAYKFNTIPEKITERFVTLEKPVIKEGKVYINDVILEYDNNKFDCKLSNKTYSNHQGITTTANLIDFVCKNINDDFIFIMIIHKIN